MLKLNCFFSSFRSYIDVALFGGLIREFFLSSFIQKIWVENKCKSSAKMLLPYCSFSAACSVELLHIVGELLNLIL